VVHIHEGKGRRDRDIPLCPKLLAILREYWRWMKPKSYLLPGMENNWRADLPVTTKVAWIAVTEAAKAAGITRRVSPHTLRRSYAIVWGFDFDVIDRESAKKFACLPHRNIADIGPIAQRSILGP
jgi:integrase